MIATMRKHNSDKPDAMAHAPWTIRTGLRAELRAAESQVLDLFLEQVASGEVRVDGAHISYPLSHDMLSSLDSALGRHNLGVRMDDTPGKVVVYVRPENNYHF